MASMIDGRTLASVALFARSPDSVRHYENGLIKLWLALQVGGGQIGIPLLLLTLIFSKLKTKRLPTLYNLLATWVVSSVISCLLFYAGRQFPSDPEPSFELCLMQASLIYAAPFMTAISAFAFMYEGFLAISGKAGILGKLSPHFRSAILLMVPWFGLIAIGIPTFVVGLSEPSRVNRSRRVFHCGVMTKPELTDTLAALVALVLFMTIIWAVRSAFALRAAWLEYKLRVEAGSVADMRTPSTAVRVLVFGAYLVITLVLSIVSIAAPKTPFPDLFASSVPTAVFLIFATQTDIIKIWVKLLPKFIVPKSWSAWATSDDEERLPPSTSHTAASPVTPERSSSNSFDVWKQQNFDSSLDGRPQAHVIAFPPPMALHSRDHQATEPYPYGAPVFDEEKQELGTGVAGSTKRWI